jgi:adenine phosphoribosyltransferase
MASIGDRIRAAIRDVPDFPKPGILFKDLTPVLSNGPLFQATIEVLSRKAAAAQVTKIVGIDARGFIFGAAVAAQLGLGFIPVRKRGKLPWRTVSAAYTLEYGEAVVEMHEDAVATGETVALVDDLLATGGTAAAAIELIQRAGGIVGRADFVVELEFLKGRNRLGGIVSESLVSY